MTQIILRQGDAQTPPRFWGRMVCESHEFTDELKRDGWAETDSRSFLSDDQINQLNKQNEPA